MSLLSKPPFTPVSSDRPEDRLENSLRRRVRKLVGFGHRGSATENEHRAAEYLLGKLKEYGLEANKEAFAGSRSMGARILVHVLLAMASAVLLPWLPIASSLIVAIVLTSLIMEQMTRGVWLSRCCCRAISYNVIGHIAALKKANRRVVLCAHYDTQKIGWIWNVYRLLESIFAHCPVRLKPPMLALVPLMLAQLALAVLACIRRDPTLLSTATGILLAAYALFAVFMLQWAMGKSVPGAADNASGVAAAMKIASSWPKERPADDVELLVLLTGCEESGLLGAAAWADRHREELNSLPTSILNIDGIGFGPPRFLRWEVPAVGQPIRAPSSLIKICAETAHEMGLIEAGPRALPGPTDALAFLARGIRAISIVGFSDGYWLPNYHTMEDVLSQVNFAAVCTATDFAKKVAFRLALPDAQPTKP